MKLFPRFLERSIRDALQDTRVVLLSGPRQSGKTTLARRLAVNTMRFVSLDDPTTLDAARSDPLALVRDLDRAVVDEVQRAPALILAIKRSVDDDPRPGRFLLTGSANLMALPRLADSLAGRMAITRLLPLAQAELRGDPSSFLDCVFTGKTPQDVKPVVADRLVETVIAGGYPEVLQRSSVVRRQAWHRSYVEALLQRDLRDIRRIDRMAMMPRLLRALAACAGQLANYSALGKAIGLNHATTRAYASVLENAFLLRMLPPWHTNMLKRIVKTPKIQFLDSGLLAALRGIGPDHVRRQRSLFGPILESFVYAELLKLAGWADSPVTISHYRDAAGNEVDFVLENSRGEIVGIEVKAAATVYNRDFSGLRRLANACGSSFKQGLVLCDHDEIIRFGDRFAAAPVSVLWSG